MKKLWKLTGQIVFWSSWPLLWLYLRFNKRTRVLVIHQDRVLLVHSWHSAGQWSLPGGGLHRGEEPTTGAVREAREETGILIKPDQLTLLKEGVSGNRGLRYRYICYFTQVEEMIEPKVRLLEIVDAAWVPINEVNLSTAAKDTVMFLDSWQHR
ncbi:MAG TPA: NUDIX hydrolase [Candidatus Saccharimonadales bacterium]|nr:NUDIX hydrolase [Candidatus Saccharimonadales bacterium]